jgi:hypothetical protein
MTALLQPAMEGKSSQILIPEITKIVFGHKPA